MIGWLFNRAKLVVLDADAALYRARVRLRLARSHPPSMWWFVALATLLGCAHSRVDAIHAIEQRCVDEIAHAVPAGVPAIEQRCNAQITEAQHGR